jgi:hypothetical protein
VAGFRSPLDGDHHAVALIGTDAQAQRALALALNDTYKISQMRGDLTLLRGNAIESFRINEVQYVGDLPWWRRAWFALHQHPCCWPWWASPPACSSPSRSTWPCGAGPPPTRPGSLSMPARRVPRRGPGTAGCRRLRPPALGGLGRGADPGRACCSRAWVAAGRS